MMKREQAEGNFKIAEYYEKRRKWDGAEIYYNEAVDLAPETEIGTKALQRLDEVKRKREAMEAAKEADK